MLSWLKTLSTVTYAAQQSRLALRNSVSADDLIEKVKQLIREGNVTRIVVKDEKGRVLFEIPATVGVVGAVLVPWLAALGAIAALATRCTIVVEKAE